MKYMVEIKINGVPSSGMITQETIDTLEQFHAVDGLTEAVLLIAEQAVHNFKKEVKDETRQMPNVPTSYT